MSLENHIPDIQKKLKNMEYTNEQSISQGIVLRLLSALDWPVYDTQLVIPEYNIQGRRVDFALCAHKNKPVIFIEVKQPGNTLGADKQLFEYAFHTGVPFAIVTDGKEWHFYLPAEVGSYDERRVYKLDLIEREVHESSYRLERYLLYGNVISGCALDNAREDYKNVSKERQAKANIPVAWEKLVEEKDEILLDVISDKVESICGFKPTPIQILNFLKSLQTSVGSIIKSPSTAIKAKPTKPFSATVTKPKKPSSRSKIKAIFPDGVEICLPKVADTMVEIIRKIGFDKVKSLDIQMYGFPIVSDKKHRQDKYNWSDAGHGVFVFTHSNTDKKLSQLNEINDALSLDLLIEKV
ncbi:MAG: type I restriction enzyme HsdR N-terminal domain-containing protein [Candidatus Marinimicrobia bacterium]|nr:type I restriction enzyme HsdR N-terminal domain-containing protein [Candidatus Neomarinimicrobiota bacterium]